MKSKKLMHFRYLFYPFLAFLFGIAIAKGLFAAKVLGVVLTCVLFAVFLVFMICYRKWKGIALVLAFFLAGGGFYFLGLHISSAPAIESECVVIGRVTDSMKEYSSYDSKSYYIVLEDVLINGESNKNVYAKISASKDDEISPGDKLTFKTNLTVAKLFNLNSLELAVSVIISLKAVGSEICLHETENVVQIV